MMVLRRRSTATAPVWGCRLLGSACALFMLVSGSFVAPASAASNGLWSVYPTTSPGHPSRIFVEPELTPGQRYTDSVTVANYTAAPLTFNLYASDAFNTPGGGLSLRRRSDPQVDIGRWITLSTSRLTVGAHSQSEVPFDILPPATATPGDHVGGIVAEQTVGTEAREGSIPVTVIQAVAVRVYGRVRGQLTPRLTLHETTLHLNRPGSSEFGGPVSAHVRFTLSNSGNEVLTPQTVVSLHTPFGQAARRSFDVGQLLPGNSLSYSLSFPHVMALGHVQAQVTAATGKTKATSTASAWAMPWVLIAIVVLIILLAVLLVVRRLRRRTRKEPDDSPASDDAPEPDDAVESDLAHARHARFD